MKVAAWTAGVYLGWWGLCAGFVAAADPAAVLATVNARKITAGDVEFFGLARGLDAAQVAAQQSALLDQLIDRELIRGFLAGKKVAPNAEALDLQIHQLEELARRRGEDPDKLFPKLGLTPERLRSELGLPLSWQAYVQQTATTAQIRQYFAAHQSEVDGTRVRVRQIFRPAPDDAARAAAEALLTRVKAEIVEKKTSFEDAARRHSAAPSKDQGGDVGWISTRGRLPDELTFAALGLKPGELAGPLRTSFGVHLIQVTERVAGQLSVEDARPQILERLSDELWRTTVAKERQSAKIVRAP